MGLLQPIQQQTYMNTFINVLKDSLANKTDPLWVNWIIRSLINFPFAYSWEPAFIIKRLTSGDVSTYINKTFFDAKVILRALSEVDKSEAKPKGAKPCTWYAAILTIKMKHWLIKKYQIPPKKLDSIEKKLDQQVNVSKILPLDINSLPLPPKKAELNDAITDLFAQFQSVMRMERSFCFPQTD